MNIEQFLKDLLEEKERTKHYLENKISGLKEKSLKKIWNKDYLEIRSQIVLLIWILKEITNAQESVSFTDLKERLEREEKRLKHLQGIVESPLKKKYRREYEKNYEETKTQVKLIEDLLGY